MTRKTGTLVSVLYCLALLSSCVNTRKSVYFSQADDLVMADTISAPANFIQKSDILSITVSSVNPDVAAVFNIPNNAYLNPTTYYGASAAATGYLVNAEGNIQFPVLGSVQADGLTALELQNKIANALITRKLLIDPVVSVRHLNFKVTVLGEVAHPLVINVPNEKITLLEALGLAGDITIYGKRDRVLLVRQLKGQKILKRLDLNSVALLSSPYYYLNANDILYVEPNKTRIANSGRATVWLPILLSGLSFIAIIADRITRN